MLNLHNDLRKKHNSPELKVNEDLNDLADEYAYDLIYNQGKNTPHPNSYKGIYLGENVTISNIKEPEEIFKKWSEEGKYYDFSKNKFSKKASHFTQIIWKETTEIGMSFFPDQEKKQLYVVLLYYPPGNSLGSF